MAVKIEEIQAPINAEMKKFEQNFKKAMKSNVMLLDNIMGYIVKKKGKQIRPILVMLSAGIVGEIQEATYRGAALIELLHTATLVHDDVVDDSHYRRGFFSVNALWKNKIAVLVGDYLLSRGMLLAIDNGDFSMLRIVSRAVREIIEGELLQSEKARRLDITEDIYFEIIRQKTATLIASCCGVGASSVGGSDEVVENMHTFGEKIGIAFQIKDDLFDYGDVGIGKPRGIDIKEKKMTLPLIHSLSKVSKSEKRHIIYLIKNQSHKPDKVKEVISFVKDTGGIEYATEVMETYVKEAKKIIATFPSSEYKTSLEKLITFVIERKK